MRRKLKLSPTSALHYAKLVFRSGLLLAALVLYVVNRVRGTGRLFGRVENDPIILMVIWLVFVVEMIFRFFPARIESMGCQKQFAGNYIPTDENVPKLQSWKSTFAIIAVWTVLNGFFGFLYLADIIDSGILILISLAYGICDMICILFFCPFQTWFMKNRCCTVCRIYNWDFAMMFTPLIFIPNVYSWSLAAMSLILLARWEITLRKHPERFADNTNACLSCENCKEKLCYHKKQLKSFWNKNKIKLNPRREK